MQNVFPLNYNSSVKITVGKYYIPSGRCIQSIDYSKKINGKAVQYSDSSKQKFSTKNGRPVFDAGGILPDISIQPDSLSEIAVSLILKNHIFNFATEYVSKHETIATPDKFGISKSDYNDFINYLEGREYDYKTKSEKKMEELIEAMKEDKYYPSATNEVENLKAKVSHNKQRDLELFEKEISEIISNEIVSRYYYQKVELFTICKTTRKCPKLLKSFQIQQNTTEFSRLNNYANKTFHTKLDSPNNYWDYAYWIGFFEMATFCFPNFTCFGRFKR